MLHYRSKLLRIIETIGLSPFLIGGHMVEQQQIYIEFFDDFSDNPLNPAVAADFEIKSRYAEIYEAELMIHAKFSGLRYFMFYYPITTAFVGSSLNFAILSLVVLLSWIRFFSNQGDDEVVVIHPAKDDDDDEKSTSSSSSEEEEVEDLDSRLRSKLKDLESESGESNNSICVLDSEDKQETSEQPWYTSAMKRMYTSKSKNEVESSAEKKDK